VGVGSKAEEVFGSNLSSFNYEPPSIDLLTPERFQGLCNTSSMTRTYFDLKFVVHPCLCAAKQTAFGPVDHPPKSKALF